MTFIMSPSFIVENYYIISYNNSERTDFNETLPNRHLGLLHALSEMKHR